MARMRECFRDWGCDEAAALVGGDLRAAPRREGDEEAAGVCDGCRGGEGGGGHGDAHAFWSRVERCEVQLDDNLISATTLLLSGSVRVLCASGRSRRFGTNKQVLWADNAPACERESGRRSHAPCWQVFVIENFTRQFWRPGSAPIFGGFF
ncbi:putative retrotransposon hot spot protein 4 (RHS4) [Trypanosoma vivax]|nr:putative retrotransposon hot spot protein 4 (RHS4) [Trypanosoma vivax]